MRMEWLLSGLFLMTIFVFTPTAWSKSNVIKIGINAPLDRRHS